MLKFVGMFYGCCGVVVVGCVLMVCVLEVVGLFRFYDCVVVVVLVFRFDVLLVLSDVVVGVEVCGVGVVGCGMYGLWLLLSDGLFVV